jgi:hypothetical protein
MGGSGFGLSRFISDEPFLALKICPALIADVVSESIPGLASDSPFATLREC